MSHTLKRGPFLSLAFQRAMQALDVALNCGIDPAAPWVTHLTAAYADNGSNKGTGGNRSSRSSNRNSSSNKGAGEGEGEERVRATLDRGKREYTTQIPTITNAKIQTFP